MGTEAVRKLFESYQAEEQAYKDPCPNSRCGIRFCVQ